MQRGIRKAAPPRREAMSAPPGPPSVDCPHHAAGPDQRVSRLRDGEPQGFGGTRANHGLSSAQNARDRPRGQYAAECRKRARNALLCVVYVGILRSMSIGLAMT